MTTSAGDTDSSLFIPSAARPASTSKTCTKCGADKPTTEFSRDAHKSDGLHPSCRECRRGRKRCPSDVNRAERRNEQKRAEREAMLERNRERAAALNYASLLRHQLESAPDEQARKDLRRTIKGILLRWKEDENDQRLAVLRSLERRELSTLADIVNDTKLAKQIVRAILDDFTSPDVDLVSIHTMGGKRDCGRGGTTLYYRLRR